MHEEVDDALGFAGGLGALKEINESQSSESATCAA
jgi:hypothetical protein